MTDTDSSLDLLHKFNRIIMTGQNKSSVFMMIAMSLILGSETRAMAIARNISLGLSPPLQMFNETELASGR